MADIKISALTELLVGPAGSDYLPIVDVSAGETKKITTTNFFASIPPLNLATISAAIAAPANRFLFADATSQIVGYNTWQIDPTSFFSNVDNTVVPNNLGAYSQAYSWNINVAPLQNSPNDSMRLHSFTVNLDAAATGFSFGTNGQAAELLGGGYNYGGNGASFGNLRGINFYNGFGNGTDPGTVHNLSASAHSYQFSANITLDGQINGYDFNLNVNAASIPTSNFNVIWMSDFSQIPIDLYGYQGVVCQPNISKIKNNHNFNAFTAFPTIGTMEGNSGFYGLAIGGTITALGTSGLSGLGINTNIGTVPATANIQGVGIFPQITTMAATSGFHGVNISPTITTLHGSVDHYQAFPQIAGGDGSVSLFSGGMGSVHTTGQTSVMNLNGMTADGKNSSFSADGVNMNIGGQLIAQSGVGIGGQHVIFTSFVVPNNTAITGTDFLMNIFSPDVDFGNAGSSVAAGPNLGINAMVAFAGQMHGHGQMDALCALLAGAIFLEDFNLTHWRGVNSVAINAGFAGTVTNASGFYHEVGGAGLFATNHWGVNIASDIDNRMSKLAINTATGKVSNASVGLEIGGTDRVLRVSNMTTVELLALTALPGMVAFDTTLDTLVYTNNAGVWTAV